MKEIYDWVPWFRELARRIAAGHESDLARSARAVQWKEEHSSVPLLNYGDDNIDPFSFFYALSAGCGTKRRMKIFQSISSVFGIRSALPVDSDDALIFPWGNHFNTLFHTRGEGNPALLWRLFRSAAEGLDKVNPPDFGTALDIGQVALPKLTQTLFLINAEEFLPIDKQGTRGLLANPGAKIGDWEAYLAAVGELRDSFPGCMPYEINIFAWLQAQKEPLVSADSKFFQIASAPEFQGPDRWADDFEPKNWVYTLRPSARLKETPPISGEAHDSPYPLEEPKRGDIVLVRRGESTKEVHALGVVYENEYAKNLVSDSRIHMLWINKSTANTRMGQEWASFPKSGFSRGGRWTDVALNRVQEYEPTLRLLKKLGCNVDGGEDGSSPPPVVEPEVEHTRNQVLYGPPGTGKTYETVQQALAIIDGKKARDAEPDQQRFRSLRFDPKTGEGQIAMITFHQNFAYEDFVEGIRPVLGAEDLRYELRDGIFKRIARAAGDEARRAERFVLIIDEINRGNIAKIFGELITLLEDSRRVGRKDETRVTLPYSGEEFGVPDNLYVIGTMNTADRSIQLLDTALRRRFEFIEMMPDADHSLIPENVEGIALREMLRTMNERITLLLDREHQIGHTYLFGADTVEKLSRSFQKRIFPLLQEYFFDDWSKIRAVLGDNNFVKERDAQNAIENTELPDEEAMIYERLPGSDSRWRDPAEYQKIYETGERGAPEDS